MEAKKNPLESGCGFAGLKPIRVDLPYPPVQVSARNPSYANLLGVDYCGSVSEMSAITQYINNENRISCEDCPMARTLLGIAMAEMMHLQKLGELIVLLGGNVDFTARYPNGKQKMWTPECLNLPENAKRMLLADMEAERDAIRQYEMHISMMKDECVNAVLGRIIMDEEYHIMILRTLLKGM